ncbi:MAG: hypothetical protein U1D99_03485, partial [Candidatus Omnitrophota bacterium]|nr:hypothetical protein [Candidatus Omnitrophota bacterium]
MKWRRWLVAFFLLVFVVMSAMFAALNSAGLTVWMARRWLAGYQPSWKVEALVLAKQRFRFPARLDFENFVVKLKSHDASRSPSSGVLFFKKGSLGLEGPRKIAVRVEGLSFHAGKTILKGLAGRGHLLFSDEPWPSFEADLLLASVQADAVSARPVSARVSGNARQVDVTNMTAGVFQGRLEGRVHADFSRLPEILVDANLQGQGFRHARISTGDVVLTVQAVLERERIKSIEGGLKASSLESVPLKITGVSSRILGDDKAMHLPDFSAEAYGGVLTGEFSLEYPPALLYAVDIHLKDLEVEQLKQVNDAIFAQLQGRLSGEMKASGTPQGVDSLGLEMTMPDGGKISAELLRFVLQYLPARSLERRDLEFL